MDPHLLDPMPKGFRPLAGATPGLPSTNGLPGASPSRRSVPLIDGLFHWLGFSPEETEPTPTDFSLRQMPDGRLRYFTFATNNFKDRGDLLFPTSAQQEYVNWVERTGAYPKLWLWHARGSDLGRADKIWFNEHTQVTSGLIDEGKEELAFELAARDDLGMSHGYIGRHVDRSDGTVEVIQFREFEQSILPHKVAANFGTYFGLVGNGQREETLGRFTQEQRDWLRDVGRASPERINEMERLTTDMETTFRSLNIDWRSLEMEPGEPTPAVVTPPVPTGMAVVPGGAVVLPPMPGSVVTPAAMIDTGIHLIPGTPPAVAFSNPPVAGVGVTEADVRRIVAESTAPVMGGIESLSASVRELTERVSTSRDDEFANQYNARTRQLPQGFKASAQGQAVVGPDGKPIPAAAGARSGAGVTNEGRPLDIDRVMNGHPLLASQGGQS